MKLQEIYTKLDQETQGTEAWDEWLKLACTLYEKDIPNEYKMTLEECRELIDHRDDPDWEKAYETLKKHYAEEPEAEKQEPVNIVLKSVTLIALKYNSIVWSSEYPDNSSRPGEWWVTADGRIEVNRLQNKRISWFAETQKKLREEVESYENWIDQLEDELEEPGISSKYRRNTRNTIEWAKQRVEREKTKIRNADADIEWVKGNRDDPKKRLSRAMMIARKLGDTDAFECMKNPDQFTDEARKMVMARYIGTEI